MALQQFLALVGGYIKQISPVQASTGSADAGSIPALDSSGKLDASMIPSSVSAASVVTATASESISAGALVNVYNNAGTTTVQNADNSTTGKEANGFASAAIASGASGTVTLAGEITGLSGLTAGQDLWLGTVGATTTAPPTTAGTLTQLVGFALTATSMMFRPQQPVQN